MRGALLFLSLVSLVSPDNTDTDDTILVRAELSEAK